MKKLSNLLSASLLLILSLGVMSCSKDKDDDDVELSAASLVGIWDSTNEEYYIDGEKCDFEDFIFLTLGNIVNYDWNGDGVIDKNDISFLKLDNPTSTYMEYASDGTVTTNITLTVGDTDSSTEGKCKFEVSGNKIILTEIDETGEEEVNQYNREVVSFDGKTMSLKGEESNKEGHICYTVTTWTKR